MSEFGAAIVASQSRFHHGNPEGEPGIRGSNANGERPSSPLIEPPVGIAANFSFF